MPEDTDRPAERPLDQHPADPATPESPGASSARAAAASASGPLTDRGPSDRVAVRPSAVQPAPAWRGRTTAVVSKAAEVARRPAVAGAAATVAGVAARIAVELVARRIAGAPTRSPAPLDVTGRVIHHVHVVHHVHVLHHRSDPLILPALPVVPRR